MIRSGPCDPESPPARRKGGARLGLSGSHGPANQAQDGRDQLIRGLIFSTKILNSSPRHIIRRPRLSRALDGKASNSHHATPSTEPKTDIAYVRKCRICISLGFIDFTNPDRDTFGKLCSCVTTCSIYLHLAYELSLAQSCTLDIGANEVSIPKISSLKVCIFEIGIF